MLKKMRFNLGVILAVITFLAASVASLAADTKEKNITGVIQIACAEEEPKSVMNGAFACLFQDGTVRYFQADYYSHKLGSLDKKKWSHIKMIDMGTSVIIGLKDDGTIVVEGAAFKTINTLKDIVSVKANSSYIFAIKKDGTIYEGDTYTGKIVKLKNIVHASYYAPEPYFERGIVVNKDGSVLVVGDSDKQLEAAKKWIGIKQAAVGPIHAAAVKNDGTVVATGLNTDNQCDVSGWADIAQIAVSYNMTMGLKKDGTVVVAGKTSEIKNMKGFEGKKFVQLDSNGSIITALTDTGEVVTTWELPAAWNKYYALVSSEK
ncbi:MAG: putative regulator of chromosome condensation [Clostridia bacterium]|jgi:alpha-tubulin suppressor-like RCC1 family protein|nr:putative regulator of chromosome condensation [Clostridia bacterium]